MPEAHDVLAHLEANVEGTVASLTDSEIGQSTDMAKVRKYYKLNGAPGLDIQKDEGTRAKETELLVLGSMSLRGL